MFKIVAVFPAPAALVTENTFAVIPAAAVIVSCVVKICAKLFAAAPRSDPTAAPPEIV